MQDKKKIYNNPPILFVRMEVKYQIKIGRSEFIKKVDTQVYSKIRKGYSSDCVKRPVTLGSLFVVEEKEAKIGKAIIGYSFAFEDIIVEFRSNGFAFTVTGKYLGFQKYKKHIQELFNFIKEDVEEIVGLSVQVVNKMEFLSTHNVSDYLNIINNGNILKNNSDQAKSILCRYIIEKKNSDIKFVITDHQSSSEEYRNILLDITCFSKLLSNDIGKDNWMNKMEFLKDEETDFFNGLITEKAKILFD